MSACLDIPRRFCHRTAMTSLPIAGKGMISTRACRVLADLGSGVNVKVTPLFFGAKREV